MAQKIAVLLRRPIVRQFIKFGIVGMLNTGIDIALLSAFHYLLHIPEILANTLSFSIAVTNSYLMNRRWTFSSDNKNWRAETVKFFIVNIIGLVLSDALLWMFVHRFGLQLLLAKAAAVVIVLFWNFAGIRFWAFRRPPQGLPG